MGLNGPGETRIHDLRLLGVILDNIYSINGLIETCKKYGCEKID